MNAAASGPPSVVIAGLARDLHMMGAATRKAVAKRMAGEAGPLLADARQRASWSTRIPGAISVRGIASENLGTAGVTLRVSAAIAPHARPYEGLGGAAQFRHPVYGHDVWVSQATRPYAMPAVAARAEDARQAIVAAFEDAARECGFR